jgi:hypothetical protein
MFTNYHEMKTLIRDHQSQIDEDVKKYRLIRKSKTSRPKIKDRLLLSLGRQMVAAGFKLQKQAKPAFAPCQGDYQTC